MAFVEIQIETEVGRMGKWIGRVKNLGYDWIIMSLYPTEADVY